MSVQISPWKIANVITSQSPVFGLHARSMSHAAGRRSLNLRRARAVAGKTDAVSMLHAVSAFCAEVESAWREERPLKSCNMVAALIPECYPATHDDRPYFQHSKLLHRCPYR